MTRVAIVGGEPAGLMTARQLERQRGTRMTITLLEASGRLTWVSCRLARRVRSVSNRWVHPPLRQASIGQRLLVVLARVEIA